MRLGFEVSGRDHVVTELHQLANHLLSTTHCVEPLLTVTQGELQETKTQKSCRRQPKLYHQKF